MSFQTFNLFNFFQQPNTGKHKILDRNELDIATSPILNNSGAVADFNWFFPYARKVIPNAIILGGVPFPLLSDAYETSRSVIGIRHPEAKINLYGNFLKDINKESLKIYFSGHFFPKLLGEENSKIFISGLTTGEPPDIYLSKLTLSGEVTNAKLDYNYVESKISGSFSEIFFDFPDIKTAISGIIESGIFDFSTLENKISGNYIPLYKDDSNLEYFLVDFSTGKGVAYINKIIEDEISALTYSLNYYSKNSTID